MNESESILPAPLPIPGATTPMRSPALFRYRVVIFAALYLIGFNVPWSHYFNLGADSTTWMVLCSLLARTGLLKLDLATVAVTLLAIVCAAAGAALRLWATAYISAGVMNDKSLRADHVVASGPYRYLRHPLYLGNMLTCVAVSILMPPIGSVFFLVGCGLLTAALVAAEGPHLQQQLGAAYAAYRKQIPAFIPAIRPHVASSEVKPEVKQHWAQAFAAESFHVGFAVCLAIFGWEYNVDLLIRCLLICFGVALVANGIFSSRGMRPATEPPV